MNLITIKFKSKRRESKAFSFVTNAISEKDFFESMPSFSGTESPKDADGKREFTYEFAINDEIHFIKQIKKSEVGNDIIDIKVEYNVTEKTMEELIDELFN